MRRGDVCAKSAALPIDRATRLLRAMTAAAAGFSAHIFCRHGVQRPDGAEAVRTGDAAQDHRRLLGGMIATRRNENKASAF